MAAARRCSSSLVVATRGFPPGRRRVVVTGLGAITPLGATFVDSWRALVAGRSGVTDLTSALRHQHEDNQHGHDGADRAAAGASSSSSSSRLEHELDLARSLPCQVAAPVRDCPHYDSRTTARFVQFALVAAQEAIEQSQLPLPRLDSTRQPPPPPSAPGGDPNDPSYLEGDEEELLRLRTGVCIASGMSSVREVVHAYETLQRNYRKLSPHFVPKVLTNSASGRVALRYGLRGPNHAASTACAAGTHAIGDAYRMIQWGSADVMLAGGAEASLDPLSLAGFGRLRALSTSYNENPTIASRPFDRGRDGFVMGEGAAVLVLEGLDHALKRGATIMAEITGYGLTGDAHHVTAPDPHGLGAVRCMRQAMEEHVMSSSSSFSIPELVRHPIGYVNAHATSTPKGDEIEASAISAAFCNDAGETVRVSSTKGATGHLLGAAGALEAAFCVQALVDQTLPPPLNLDDPDIGDCPNLNLLELEGSAAPSAVMSNSFGFGGTNASITLQRWTGL